MALIAVMLLALGLFLQDVQPVLTGFLLLVLLMIGTMVAPPRLLLLRHLPHEKMVEQDRQTVGLALANAGRRGTALVELYDTVSDRIRVDRGTNRRVLQLASGEQRLMLYDIHTPLRGLYTLGPIHLRASDALGLGYRESTISDVRDLAVYPRIEEVEYFRLQSRLFKYFTGPFLTRTVGTSNEFYSMRDYVKGDPLRKINWKASARFRSLIVNEYEKETLCDIVVILDARAVNTLGTISANPLEYCVKASASIMHHFLKRRYQIGILSYGSRVQTIPPGTGERQLSKVLTLLMNIQGEGNMPLQTAVDMAMPHLGPRTSVILLSGLEFDPTMKEAIQRLSGKGYFVTIISPIPVEFEAGLTKRDTDKRDLVLLERANYLEELRGLGARIIEWRTDETVTSLIQRIELEGL